MSPLRRRDDLAVDGPGTRAIDRHVDRIDGGPEHHRYHPRAPHRFTGGGPLQEVTTHRLRQPDHWHLVTYGLSELGAKESDDPTWSGWGFELTFRLTTGAGGVSAPDGAAAQKAAGEGAGARTAGGDGAPVQSADGAGGPAAGGAGADPEPLWAVDLLTNLAAYVWSSGHAFAAGHHLDLRGPIRLDGGGDLTAAVIVADPALGVLEGPFGAVEFLQVVALTADELEQCRAWSTTGVVDLVRARDPLFVTDLARRSVLSGPGRPGHAPGAPGATGHRGAGPGAVRPARVDRELRVATLAWRSRLGRTVATLGAGAAAALGPALRRTLTADGAGFRVVGDHSEVRFVVSGTASCTTDGVCLEIGVPAGEVEGLAALFDGRVGWGRRPAWPGLRWRVVK